MKKLTFTAGMMGVLTVNAGCDVLGSVTVKLETPVDASTCVLIIPVAPASVARDSEEAISLICDSTTELVDEARADEAMSDSVDAVTEGPATLKGSPHEERDVVVVCEVESPMRERSVETRRDCFFMFGVRV